MGKLTSLPFFWQRTKRRLGRHVWIVRIAGGLIGLTVIIGLVSFLAKPALDLAAKVLIGPRLVSAFLTDPVAVLDSKNNRTNLLVLGIAGGEHEGLDLTDTMIFTSIDLASGDVVMLSIPRDIWLDSLQAKINTAYHYGEEKSSGGGFVLAKDAVYQITDQPIHYTVLLDFSGFVKAVDLVGGIDVDIDRAFTDEKYPIPGKETDECNGDPDFKCRYETIRFDKGISHMDGETALKFVRSRNAEGEEGTDFARSTRQQKVILAFKNKLLSKNTLLSPGKLLALKRIFADHVKLDQDLSQKELAGFANLFWRFVRGENRLRTLTLDTGSKENPGFLVNPPLNQYDQWVLVPRGGSWEKFQEFLKQKLEAKI